MSTQFKKDGKAVKVWQYDGYTYEKAYKVIKVSPRSVWLQLDTIKNDDYTGQGTDRTYKAEPVERYTIRTEKDYKGNDWEYVKDTHGSYIWSE